MLTVLYAVKIVVIVESFVVSVDLFTFWQSGFLILLMLLDQALLKCLRS